MRLGLVLGEAASGLRRNFSMVVSVVLVTFISLTFVGTAVLLQLQIGQMKGYWYDRAQVAVYLCGIADADPNCVDGEATEAQVAAIETQLGTEPLASYVKSYEFEDHEAAFTRFQKEFAGEDVLDYVSAESLPQTFWVSLADVDQSEVIVDSLSDAPGVLRVVDQRSYLDQIFTILNIASYTAIGIAALMLIAAALLISTTIRLSAFSRRREISIMRLVGASNRFIQTPFILEGVVAALIGSILSGVAILAVIKFFVTDYLAPTLGGVSSFVGMADGLMVVPFLVAIGIVLAALSASFAISRYLKV